MAGPLGSTLALFLGAVALIFISVNYYFLAQRYPDSGGSYSYVRKELGVDHGFLCAWFLWLVYAAIICANATAFALLVGRFFGGVLKFGARYIVAGYVIYAGEAIFTIAIIMLFLLIGAFRNRLAIQINTLFGILLFVCTLCCFVLITEHVPDFSGFSPNFVPNKNIAIQIFSILSLAPWAFVGFEAVSNVSGEMTGSRRSLLISMGIALLSAALVYSLLIFIAASPIEMGVNWSNYAALLQDPLSNVELTEMPVLKAVQEFLGAKGTVILGIAVLSAVGTGLMGFALALSRLSCKLGEDGILPVWFSWRDKNNIPRNAIFFIMAVAILISFTGRTAIGWIVDITSICATIVYFYVSAAAYKLATKEGNSFIRFTGALGIFFALSFSVFSFMPNIWSIGNLATESYFLFALWGIFGFVYYLYLFRKDKAERYGQSSLVWIVMLCVIFLSSLMWMRQEIRQSAFQLIDGINHFYEMRTSYDPGVAYNVDTSYSHFEAEKKDFIEKAFFSYSVKLTKHSLIQIFLIMISVGVVFAVYSLMHTRRKKIELEKIKAEETSRSKSTFLSNMSHDIRTPMNAIIGFTDLALTKNDVSVVHDYLNKIKVSSNHLLSLINDVLEMSRIESGRVELQTGVVSIPELLHNLSSIILGQIEAKQQDIDVNAVNVHNEVVICDRLRLNQILLNLLSNAIKYTQAGGHISVTVSQKYLKDDIAHYEFRVKDNGFGMSPQFAARIFEAFERENNETINKIQGTGLGMAITKHLVDLMGGEIRLETEQGKGSEFILDFDFPVAERSISFKEPQLKGLHALVADDDYGACDALTGILSEMDVRAEWTMMGKEAILRYNDALKRDDPFDLCIIDWKMPDMSGIQVASEISKNCGKKKVAIILVTAYDWLNVKDEAIAAGVKAFCNKPVFASEMREAILRAMGMKDEATRESVEVERKDFSGKRVLLVDDIDVNREIAAELLSMHNFEVEQAADGQEAVEKISEAAPNYYDVVFMDVQMPNMNGYEATKAIRALDKEKACVPIIAMTANAFDEDRQAALKSGMDGHIAKPIDMDKVIDSLTHILKERN